MNQRQTVAMWAGLVIVIAMFLYPPWHSMRAPVADHGYAFLITGPQSANTAPLSVIERMRQEASPPSAPRPPLRTRIRNARINYPRLVVQWLLVAVVTAAAIATLKDKPRSSGRGDGEIQED